MDPGAPARLPGHTTFTLIHGAGGSGAQWRYVEPLLRARGHDVVSVDLPCDDDAAGLAAYTDAVLAATGDRSDAVLVAQSLGGFTAPLVAARRPVDAIVLVAAMIPAPGETGDDWWANTAWPRSPIDDLDELFLHD